MVIYDPNVPSKMRRVHDEFKKMMEQELQSPWALNQAMRRNLDTVPEDWSYMWTTQPWFDACVNEIVLQKQPQDYPGAHVVVGSLGFGDDDHVFWDMGDASWTEFVQFKSDPQIVDAYFWIETSDGRIYDVLRKNCLACVLLLGIRLEDENFPVLIDGRTRDEMRQKRIHYYPAPQMTQTLILEYVKRCQQNLTPLLDVIQRDLAL